MSDENKSVKALRKEIELKREQVELREAEAKLEMVELQLDVERRSHARMHLYDPREAGEFFLYGGLDSGSCHSLLKDVDRFAYLHDNAPIRIVFETPGGSVLPGLGLYDSLRVIADNGHHLTTVVRGYSASLGAVLLQAGDERLIGPESHLMLHEISSFTAGKLHEQEDDLKFSRMLNTRLFEIVARRTNGKYTGASLYKKVKATDWWLTSEQAISEGFADRVG